MKVTLIRGQILLPCPRRRGFYDWLWTREEPRDVSLSLLVVLIECLLSTEGIRLIIVPLLSGDETSALLRENTIFIPSQRDLIYHECAVTKDGFSADKTARTFAPLLWFLLRLVELLWKVLWLFSLYSHIALENTPSESYVSPPSICQQHLCYYWMDVSAFPLLISLCARGNQTVVSKCVCVCLSLFLSLRLHVSNAPRTPSQVIVAQPSWLCRRASPARSCGTHKPATSCAR